MNKDKTFDFFKNQSFQFKLYFCISIIVTLLIFLMDSFSIVTILPIILETDSVNYENSLYYEYIPNFIKNFLIETQKSTLIILFVLILLFRNIFYFSQNLITYALEKHLEIETSKKVFDYKIRKSFLDFYQSNSGDLLKDFRDSISGFCLYVSSFIRMICEITLTLFLIIFLLYISFIETVIISIFFSLVSVFYKLVFYNLTGSLGKEQNLSASKINQTIIEVHQNYLEVILRKLKRKYLDKFLNHIIKFSRSRLLANLIRSSTKQFFEICILIFFIIIFLITSSSENLREYIPLILIYTISIYRILPLVNGIITNFMKIKSFKFAYEIIQKIIENHNLKYNSVVKDNIIKEKIKFDKEISFRNLSYIYPKTNKKILNNINFEVKKGELIGIVGESGSGKSTLIKILMGIISQDNFKIYVDGKKIHMKDLVKFQNLIGYLPQQNFLIDGTISENVAFGENDIDYQLVKNSLVKADCYKFVNLLKNKLKHIVKENGKNFSIGQLQRLGMARIIYFNNQILFLDEPTSALDKISELKFIKLIKKLKKNKTMIIVSHQKNILKDCDKIFQLENKKLKKIDL